MAAQTKTKNKTSVLDMCYIAIFTAIICVCSQISLPLPLGVPLTLQTLIIPLAGIVLGARKGTVAVMIYILLGAVGLPVFSGLKGGIGTIMGPTGGFILSFAFMSLLAGFGARSGKIYWLIAGLTLGAVINFLTGMLFFSFITSSAIQAAFLACVLPFIPTAVIKIVMLVIIGVKVKGTAHSC